MEVKSRVTLAFLLRLSNSDMFRYRRALFPEHLVIAALSSQNTWYDSAPSLLVRGHFWVLLNQGC
jgi:hypothetical protein